MHKMTPRCTKMLKRARICCVLKPTAYLCTLCILSTTCALSEQLCSQCAQNAMSTAVCTLWCILQVHTGHTTCSLSFTFPGPFGSGKVAKAASSLATEWREAKTQQTSKHSQFDVHAENTGCPPSLVGIWKGFVSKAWMSTVIIVVLIQCRVASSHRSAYWFFAVSCHAYISVSCVNHA